MNSLSMKIELQFSAINLKSKDIVTASDPFAKILQRTKQGKWVPVKETERIGNNDNPQWNTAHEVDYYFEKVQEYCIQIYDYDRNSSHDFLGQATFNLSQVMGAIHQEYKVKLVKPGKPNLERGFAIIRGHQIGEKRSDLVLKMRAHKLDSKDLFGFGKSDPFFILHKRVGGEYKSVYRSEHIDNCNNPTWEQITIPVSRLINSNNLDEKIKMQVYDHDRDGSHDLIGDCAISINELVQASKTKARFTLVHPPTKSKYRKKSYKGSGFLEIEVARVEERFTILDYVEGGCEINLTVAIDYTQSNGHPSNPNSLHHYNPQQLNHYQQAIQAVGSILLEYDHDKKVPLFGFGGFVNGATTHCFPLSKYGPEVDGVPGIMRAYHESFEFVQLSGPTFFSEIINTAAASAYNPEVSQQMQKYSVLLIITDGIINDMQQTIDAIVAASNVGLSVIIVGVGNADFSAMEALDGDDQGLLSSSGVVCSRDIVQFVPFNQVGPNLAQQTLAEIPHQLVEYFYGQHGIKPNKSRNAIVQNLQGVPSATAVSLTPNDAQNLAEQGRSMISQAFAL